DAGATLGVPAIRLKAQLAFPAGQKGVTPTVVEMFTVRRPSSPGAESELGDLRIVPTSGATPGARRPPHADGGGSAGSTASLIALSASPGAGRPRPRAPRAPGRRRTAQGHSARRAAARAGCATPRAPRRLRRV